MGKRRRRRSRESFWTQQFGGMPVWGFAAAVGLVVLIGAGIALVPRSSDAAAPAPTRTARTEFSFEKKPTPEPTTEWTTVDAPRTGDTLDALFIGDSITYGYYTGDRSDSFQPVMVRLLEKDGPVVAETVATPGATTAEVAERVTTIDPNLDLVVVELGTNDAWRSTLDDFTTAYTALLDRVREEAPDAGLVCVGTLTYGGSSSQINPVIEDECTTRGGAFRPMADITTKAENKTPIDAPTWDGPALDGNHPNKSGHRLIAERLIGALS